MKSRYWLLFLMIMVAPVSLALDQEQELTPSVESALQLLINGDVQTEVPSILSSGSDVGKESASISVDLSSLKFSESAMKDLFENITHESINSKVLGEGYSLRGHSARDDRNLNLISNYPAYLEDVQIKDKNAASQINMDMGYLYYRASEENALAAKQIELQRDVGSNLHNVYTEDKSENIIRFAKDNAATEGLTGNYYYEKKSETEITSSSSKADHVINSSFDYIFKNAHASQQKNIAPNAMTEAMKADSAPTTKVQTSRPLLETMANLKYIYDLSTSETGETVTSGTDVFNIMAGTNSDLNQLMKDEADDPINPYLKFAGLTNFDLTSSLSRLDGGARSPRNYAVVIGINNYTDRNSLHTSVNDADTIAAILESYGYEVTKLTDQTMLKPTKSNILENALNEIKHKKDLGKILIYFSGHGEKKSDQYYLIPQDGNGIVSSYISAEELQSAIWGLEGVAIVVDACNSGGMGDVVEKGQIMLVSSEKNQPSNEIWLGSLSLFTYNLCNALREEEKSSKTVMLERCFYKAREATERWSSWRLLAQNPQMEDRTDGHFILK